MTNLNKKRYPRVIDLFKFKQKLPEKRAGLFNLSSKRLKHPLKEIFVTQTSPQTNQATQKTRNVELESLNYQ